MIFLAKKFVLSMIIRIFAATESATLPIRTANQGGSFAFYGYIKKALSIIHSAISVRILEEVHQPCFLYFLPIYQSLSHIIQFYRQCYYLALISLEWFGILLGFYLF